MQTNSEKKTVASGEKAKDVVKKADVEEHADFNWFQKWVFPVHAWELLKVVPVVLLLALALFVYTGYRDVKDPIVYGGEGQSLMTVQYCKVIVMITAIPVAAIFLKLDNIVSFDFIFFQTVLLFGVFFLLNGYVFYPYSDVLHHCGSSLIRSVRFNNSEADVERLLPLIGSFIFPVNTFTYVFSELWGTISVSFLVWGYVNQVTPKVAAKRYYAVLGLGGQFGSLLGGTFVGALSERAKGKGSEAFIDNMKIVNLVMCFMCALFAAVYAFLQYYIMKLPQFELQSKKDAAKKKGGDSKPKMTVGEAFKYCLSNMYVLALCGMVFAYGFVMVLGELTYKDLMKLSFEGDKSAYAEFKSLETGLCAGAAIFLMIFVGHNVIRVFGWLVTAMLAPVVAGILGSLMYVMAMTFSLYTSKEGTDGTKYYPNYQNMDKLELVRTIGLIFAVATKSMKYSSFDPAKELAFLSLNAEQKYKAKAAVDIIGARFGKGAGALFNIAIISLALGSSVSFTMTCLVVSFAGVMFGFLMWLASDIYIARNKDRVAEENKEEARKAAPTLESVQVEGNNETHLGTEKHGFHIEMSTNPDASFTDGKNAAAGHQTPMPSRQNTPEGQ
jgi:AAA family ATP:ADP antiporter